VRKSLDDQGRATDATRDAVTRIVRDLAAGAARARATAEQAG
jgi:hypothetical protein